MTKVLFYTIILTILILSSINFAYPQDHIDSKDEFKQIPETRPFIIKFGLDFKGELEHGEGRSEYDVDNSPSISGEAAFKIAENVRFGIGGAFQINRGLKDYEGTFSSIPVYGLFRIEPSTSVEVAPFFIAHCGYNFWKADSSFKGNGSEKGGLYYAFGGGLLFNNVQIELLYSFHKGKIEGITDEEDFIFFSTFMSNTSYNPLLMSLLTPYDIELNYSNFTISIGINF